jgi:hypothetical protein
MAVKLNFEQEHFKNGDKKISFVYIDAASLAANL